MTGPWRDIMLGKDVSRLDLWCIVLSTMVCGIFFCRAGHDPCVQNLYGVFGEGTRLAMPKTICVPDASSLKPGSGATEGVLD